MKTYKVCLDCVKELQNLRYRHTSLAIIKNGEHVYKCKNNPRCFDQPERSKREDICCCTKCDCPNIGNHREKCAAHK